MTLADEKRLTPADAKRLDQVVALLKVAVTEAHALIRETDHYERGFSLGLMMRLVAEDLTDWTDSQACDYLMNAVKAPQVQA